MQGCWSLVAEADAVFWLATVAIPTELGWLVWMHEQTAHWYHHLPFRPDSCIGKQS